MSPARRRLQPPRQWPSVRAAPVCTAMVAYHPPPRPLTPHKISGSQALKEYSSDGEYGQNGDDDDDGARPPARLKHGHPHARLCCTHTHTPGAALCQGSTVAPHQQCTAHVPHSRHRPCPAFQALVWHQPCAAFQASAVSRIPGTGLAPALCRIPGIGRVPHSRHWSGTSLAPHSRRRPCPALPAKSGTLACAYFSSHCNRPAPCGRACLLQPPRFAASASCGARAHGGELLVRLAARRGSHLCTPTWR